MNVKEAHHAAVEQQLTETIDALARVGVAAAAEHAMDAGSIREVGEIIARRIYQARDEIRLLMWILARRNGGEIRISKQELVAAPRMPGLTVTSDGDEHVYIAHPPEGN
jgi:hypothetical protein